MERIVTASLMLLIAGLAQLSTAHPFPKEPDMQEENDAKLQQNLGHISYKARETSRETHALLVVMKNMFGRKVIQVYSDKNAFGTPLAELAVSGSIHNTKKDSGNKIAYQPSYTQPGVRTEGTIYYFNLKKLLTGFSFYGKTPCSLFVSQTDYPLIDTRISYGADCLGNYQGRHIFGSSSGYTFWIAVDKKNFFLPQTYSEWVGSIVCLK